MRSPLRLLTIAFVLDFTGPSLWRAQAGEVPPIVQAVRRAGPSRGAKISHGPSTTEQPGGLVQEARHHTFGPRSFVAGHDIS